MLRNEEGILGGRGGSRAWMEIVHFPWKERRSARAFLDLALKAVSLRARTDDCRSDWNAYIDRLSNVL